MGIDLRPGMQEIKTFSELLQAEAGEMALRQPGNTTQGPAAKPNTVVGVKSMSGPDSSGNPPKGASKGKPEDAAGSSTGRRGEKPELPINAANVVHKTACINWLTDTGVPGSHPNIVLGMLGRMELRTPSIPKSHPKSFGQCKRNTNVDRMNS